MTEQNVKKEKIFLSPKISEYNKILAKNPGSIIFINLADEYRKGKMYEESIVVLEEGLKHHPGSVPALYMMGLIYFETNNFEKSKQYLDKLLSIKGDYINALKLISKIYIYNHWITDAKNTLKKAHSLKPDDSEIQTMLSEVDPEFRSGHQEGDQEYFIEESLDLDENENAVKGEDTGKSADPSPDNGSESNDTDDAPPVSSGTVTLARLYYDQGFYNKSISIIKRILAGDPMNQEAIQLYEEIAQTIKKKNKAGGKDDGNGNNADSDEKKAGRLGRFLRSITKNK